MNEYYRNQTALSQEGYEQLAKWRQGEPCQFHKELVKGTHTIIRRCAHLDDLMVEESYIHLSNKGLLVDRAIYLCREMRDPLDDRGLFIDKWYEGDTDESPDQVWERMNQRMIEEVERAERPTG